jgi:hypothetical protein
MTLHDSPTQAGITDGNGNGAGNGAAPVQPPAPERPPSSKGTSIRLAMIVPALGLIILIIFIAAEAISPPTGQLATTRPPSIVAGGLHGVAGTALLKSITVSGQPPGNVLAAISVPRGTAVVSHVNNTAAVGQYDAQVVMSVGATQGALRVFFATAMKQQGWQVFSQGPASHDPGGLEVLGKMAGSDGHYWDMGAIVELTKFPAGAPPTGVTHFTVRLFQVPENS